MKKFFITLMVIFSFFIFAKSPVDKTKSNTNDNAVMNEIIEKALKNYKAKEIFADPEPARKHPK